jgi:peptidoglycan hydrolase-like protein with peptidoglycan-binding domain
MAMTAREKRMADMKRRFDKTSPSNRTGQSFMQRMKNDLFGDKKGMGVDDDATKTDKSAGKYRKNPPKANIAKKDTRLSPGALGGKIKPTVKKDKKVVADKKPNVIKKVVADKKSKTSASASNTKNFASTMAMQKKLIAKGAKIKADGIMGPKTRAAMAKYMKAPVPKSRPNKTMVDSFKKSNVSANKNKKAGTDSAPQDNTKPKKLKSIDSKLNSAGKYKGTNITPTKSQLEDLKRRRARASST